MTTTTIPTAPAVQTPAVPTVDPLTTVVRVTGAGVGSGCLSVFALLSHHWQFATTLALVASALFLTATLFGVYAGQVPHGA